MGQSKEEKKGNALGSAAVATASVALGYAALELGLGGVLRPGREAIQHSLGPQDEVEPEHQTSKLVDEAGTGAEAQEKKTPMEEEQVAKSLEQQQEGVDASPDKSH